MRSILALVIGLATSTFALADDSPNRWLFNLGFLKAPAGDGLTAEIATPRFWTKTREQSRWDHATDWRINLIIDDVWTKNSLVDGNGNFDSATYYSFTPGIKWTSTFAGGGQSYATVGWATFSGTNDFTATTPSGLSVGLGYGAQIGTFKFRNEEKTLLGVVNFRHVFTNSKAGKLAGNPDLFGGGYLSVGTSCSF